MTPDRPSPLFARLDLAAERELVQHADLDGVARVVVIDASQLGAWQGDLDDLDDLDEVLRRPTIISVGVAPPCPSAASARVILACDFVICTATSVWDDARDELLFAAARLLPPSQQGALTSLPAPLTGTDLEGAGLVTSIDDDPEAAAAALAVELQQVPATALIGAKRLIASALSSSLGDALALESEVQIAALAGPEHQQVVAAQLAARAAPPDED